jgi:hypothetical protein
VTKTLTRLLEIETNRLASAELVGLQLGEKIWCDRGCPADGPTLAATLEEIMLAAVKGGVRYPAIFLKRRKDLKFGRWKPAAQADGEICERCGGSGYCTGPGGVSMSLCACGAWKRPTAGQEPVPVREADPERESRIREMLARRG